jgi:hypothetical protein
MYRCVCVCTYIYQVKSKVGETLGMAMGGLRRRKAGAPADSSKGGGEGVVATLPHASTVGLPRSNSGLSLIGSGVCETVCVYVCV